jgi:hypothetical protein
MDKTLLPMLDVAIDEKVPVIETAASRATDFGERIKDAGLINRSRVFGDWVH